MVMVMASRPTDDDMIEVYRMSDVIPGETKVVCLDCLQLKLGVPDGPTVTVHGVEEVAPQGYCV